jgi:hypothetical protein
LSSSENGVSTASQMLGKLVEAPNSTAIDLRKQKGHRCRF